MPGKNQHYGMVHWLENITSIPGDNLKFRARLLDDKQITPKEITVLAKTKNNNQSIRDGTHKYNRERLIESGEDVEECFLVTDTFESVIGRPATSVFEWATAHRDEFALD